MKKVAKKGVKVSTIEKEAKMKASPNKPVIKKSTPKPPDEAKVNDYMAVLDHPLKAEIETVRAIIKNSNKEISERIKWNAPSYYYSPAPNDKPGNKNEEDMVTFNCRSTKNVHLVFHHPAIVKISSDLLQGDYKDRRMVYFSDMKDIQANKKELEKIMNELMKQVRK